MSNKEILKRFQFDLEVGVFKKSLNDYCFLGNRLGPPTFTSFLFSCDNRRTFEKFLRVLLKVGIINEKKRFEDLIVYNIKWHRKRHFIICISIRNESDGKKFYLVECDDALDVRLKYSDCDLNTEVNKVPDYISKYKYVCLI